MRGRRRAYLMPLALLLCAVLVVGGVGFLGTQARTYQTAAKSIEAVQARALAYAGVEDARSKLVKDLSFPPQGDQDQHVYTYREGLTDVASPNLVGTYTVTLDTTYAGAPYYVVRIQSDGVTPQGARHSILAEIDGAPFDRKDLSKPNPQPYGLLHWREEGLGL